jgi:hypothetical protein
MTSILLHNMMVQHCVEFDKLTVLDFTMYWKHPLQHKVKQQLKQPFPMMAMSLLKIFLTMDKHVMIGGQI